MVGIIYQYLGMDQMISATFCINWKKMILGNEQNLKKSVTMYPKVPYNLS